MKSYKAKCSLLRIALCVLYGKVRRRETMHITACTLPLLGATAAAMLPDAAAFLAPMSARSGSQWSALRPPSVLPGAAHLRLPLSQDSGCTRALTSLWSAKHGRTMSALRSCGSAAVDHLRGGHLRGGKVGHRMSATSEQVQASGPTRTIQERVDKLRVALKSEELDALIVLSGDAHQSEYVSERDKCMKYISGFTGSAGTVMVTAEGKSALVTDGRYTIQAALELDSATWQVMQTGVRMPAMPEHLRSVLGAVPKKVGVDASTCSLGTWRELSQALQPHVLVALNRSPLTKQWENDATYARPSLPTAPAAVHSVEYAGVTASEKLSQLRAALAEQGAGAIAISSLDEVAWLLNIRGADIAYCPVVMSHVLVTPSEAFLFVDDSKLSSPLLRDHIGHAGYSIRPYDAFTSTLQHAAAAGLSFWIDSAATSWGVYSALGFAGGTKKPAVEKRSPLSLPKAVKNQAEIKGLEDAHVRDGVAMSRFFAWLERAVGEGEQVDEIAAADEAEKQRRRVGGDMFRGLSFPTIAASGPHGAITHYSATEESSRLLSCADMFLCDSGAQYADGTTDVTRTMFFGAAPEPPLREAFTYVLKGHVNLASAVFPRGTLGSQLDILARAPLWKGGYDYGHGTGHGVGAYLNVHEGPHSISFRRRENEAALEPGMTSSIEPGYYQANAFGIRIENICLVRALTAAHKMDAGVQLLTFEPLTLIPFQRKLIDAALLNHEEKAYINAYHARVAATLAPLLSSADDALALGWLRHNTAPL